MGLPHRNYSVFKQAHINQWQIKVVEVKTRASEAKGPFPGGKRVGSRGKKKKNAGVKARGKRVGSRGRKRKNVGVRARGKRVGSRGKKKSKSKKCLM